VALHHHPPAGREPVIDPAPVETEPVIDLDVLEEMERVLATTSFVTAEDLVTRGGVVVPTPRPAASTMAPTELPGERPPLPRRR
jgi:hypothetical protein